MSRVTAKNGANLRRRSWRAKSKRASESSSSRRSSTSKSKRASESSSSRRRRYCPFFSNPSEILEYVTSKLGVSYDVLKPGALALCNGDVEEFVRLIYEHDSGLSILLLYYPREFNLFLKGQVPYWSRMKSKIAEEPPPVVVEEDKVGSAASSLILTVSFNHQDPTSCNYLRLFSNDKMPSAFVLPPEIGKFPASVYLGGYVYLVGGLCKFRDKFYSSKQMYAVDITDSKHCRIIDCRNMNVGKSNPFAMVAREKIYVLSSTLIDIRKENLSEYKFDFHFATRDWTLLQEDEADWYSGAFEVYDPLTQEWTILPLPHNPLRHTKLPDYYSMLHLSHTIGYAVVRNRLFFYGSYMGPCVHSFDIQTLRWNYYNAQTRDTVEVKDYYDSLAYALLDNGIYSQGLVVKDTLYAFSPWHKLRDKDLKYQVDIWAYHIPQRPNETPCRSGPLTGFRVQYVAGTSVPMPLQASLLLFGDGSFGCIHGKTFRTAAAKDRVLPPEKDYVPIPPKVEYYLTQYKVHEEEAGDDGKRSWCAEVVRSVELNGLAGYEECFLACFVG